LTTPQRTPYFRLAAWKTGAAALSANFKTTWR